VNMVSYAYNNRGGRASQSGRYGQVASFAYDTVGRLSSIAHNVAGIPGTQYLFRDTRPSNRFPIPVPEHLPASDMVRRSDIAVLLHPVDQARGAVIADAQLALDPAG
jgi:hypothetical protein